MNALNCVLQLMLLLAVVFYFGGLIAPHPFRFRLWKWSVGLVVLVFLIALVVIEVRAHPFLAFVVLVCASVLSFAVLELRRRLAHAVHRPVTTPFLSLRTTGKTATEIPDDHPFATERDEAEE